MVFNANSSQGSVYLIRLTFAFLCSCITVFVITPCLIYVHFKWTQLSAICQYFLILEEQRRLLFRNLSASLLAFVELSYCGKVNCFSLVWIRIVSHSRSWKNDFNFIFFERCNEERRFVSLTQHDYRQQTLGGVKETNKDELFIEVIYY